MIKPGIKTTELYVTLLANFAAFISNIAGTLPTKDTVYAIIAANAIYTISRGVAKFGAGQSVLSILEQLAKLGAGSSAVPPADPPA